MCVKSWSSTQEVVALSSGEAEYYGIVKGARQGLGVKALLRDMGVGVDLVVGTDSSAAKGIAMRKGLGRVKHIETNQLWVQDSIAKGVFRLVKVGTLENLGDVLTKYVDRGRIERHLRNMGFVWESGRHELAPAVSKQ